MSVEKLEELAEEHSRYFHVRGLRRAVEIAEVIKKGEAAGDDFSSIPSGLEEASADMKKAIAVREMYDEFGTKLKEAGFEVASFELGGEIFTEGQAQTDSSIAGPISPEKPARRARETGGSREALPKGARQRILVLGMLEGNEDGTDWKYQKLTEALPDIYKDLLSRKRGSVKVYPNYYQGAAQQTLDAFITNLSVVDRVNEVTSGILREIKSDPKFEEITVEQIAKALRREISYQELIGQNSPAITAPALIIGPHPLPSGPEESEPPQPDVEVDLGKIALPKMPERNTTLQERVAYSLMLIDPRRNGFEFENLEAVIREVYEEELDKLTGDARRKRIRELTDSAQRNLNGFVFLLQKSTRQEDDQVAPLVRNFLNWVERQPYYDGFAVEDIIKVLERKMSFDEVVEAIKVVGRETNHAKKNGKKPDDENQTFQPRLNRQHKYLIVERILALDPKERQKLGILLSPEDKTRLSNIRRKIEQSVPNIAFTARGYTDTLVAKLKMALANQDLYLKHLKDGESYLIYQCLKGVRTQAQIEELIRILR